MWIAIISLEDGNYAFDRLPMGVKISPDVAQAHMTEILQGIECAVYMDDVGIWTNSTFDEYLEAVEKVLQRFQ